MYDILQWNCKGLRVDVLAVLIKRFQSRNYLLYLQEIMRSSSSFNPELNYYSVFHSPLPTGKHAHGGGGALVIINKSL